MSDWSRRSPGPPSRPRRRSASRWNDYWAGCAPTSRWTARCWVSAQDIDDPESADRIIAALILNVRNRGKGLAEVLAQLTATGRETLTLRRKAAAKRAAERRACKLMIGITLGLATFLVVFAPVFIHPDQGTTGQLVLAVVLGLFAAAFAVMRRLTAPENVLPFLPRDGSRPVEKDYAVIAALTGPPSGDPSLAGRP